MGVGVDHRRAVLPEAGAGPSWRADRRAFLIVALVVLALVAVVVVRSATEPEERRCLLAPVAGAPVAATPTAALDLWWGAGGEQRVADAAGFGHAAPEGSRATRADLTQLGETTWEWRYTEQYSAGVELAPVAGRDHAYSVVSVGQCSRAPFDDRGGA